MDDGDVDLGELADHLSARREAILQNWRRSVRRDPELTTSDPLPNTDLYDHIPALLSTFERELRRVKPGTRADSVQRGDSGQKSAAAHGLQRWQQGYDLREVTRELGKLNECVVAELDQFDQTHAQLSRGAIAVARRIWAALCSTGIEESVAQYFALQQREAAGHVQDLEAALQEIRALELQRADLWRQAAHDLRGNLGVVANVTVGLTHPTLGEAAKGDFVRILMRNVTSLHHLLNDVTSLARLQAGRETRTIEAIDVSALLQELCDGLRPFAQERRLFLRCLVPAGFPADGDPVKIRRIAQNLIMNAIKYTDEGGITVSCGDSDARDAKRWCLTIRDTGSGFHTGSDRLLAQALEKPSESPTAPSPGGEPDETNIPASPVPDSHPVHWSREEGGEGLGLSIVKRLCELLDGAIEMTSEPNVGTTFRILFPRSYEA
jgi:signal transduction histidine kinase